MLTQVEKSDAPQKRKPLKLNDLLIKNVNTWGNVQYNIPLRLSQNETRTSTSIAHRLIPPIPYASDCKVDTPLPQDVCGRDMVVEKETFRTTSGEYCVKPNPNKAMERADCAINCRRVHFMTGYEKKLMANRILQPTNISEMKDNFRGVQKPRFAPEPPRVRAPDEEYIFDVVASGRNEAPVIPESAQGVQKQCDPYLTTYRNYHRPFTRDEWFSTKDHITFYTEFDIPKNRGFGPKYKPIWLPLQAKVHRHVYDRIHVKKEYHEVAASHNSAPNIKSRMKSETQVKFKHPYLSPTATWSHGVTFDLSPYPPNTWQCNIPPFMYCTDYCHIKMGTPVNLTIDQDKHPFPPHKKCVERYIVSEDFGP